VIMLHGTNSMGKSGGEKKSRNEKPTSLHPYTSTPPVHMNDQSVGFHEGFQGQNRQGEIRKLRLRHCRVRGENYNSIGM
jgi:hypothetical protein